MGSIDGRYTVSTVCRNYKLKSNKLDMPAVILLLTIQYYWVDIRNMNVNELRRQSTQMETGTRTLDKRGLYSAITETI